MNENIFRIFATIILISGFSISAYHRRKADQDSGEKVSWKAEGTAMVLVLRIGGLILWFSLIGYLIYPPVLEWSKVGLSEWVRWLGVGLGTTTVALIYWMFRSIGTGITPTVATRSEHQLITSGPYRWIRHPLYTFGTLFFLSFSLIVDSWFLALMAIFAIIALSVRLPKEESFLIEKFGDEYRTYMKKTGKYLPKLW
ncbi:MAG: isoprenylcysteine carboxylmethyltransferase family protein [Anaerolineae bacterium]|jgi:protein-S-isoprenylcysteine O-methyltransferase Ste14|nr:isoprenylcysteine carboxylmethyltransferase family protein [Anaerolineae bacterium]MBT7071863.1 isoprenylcysteine carboxylmethyltransferase family protein [Anaerolineae bacterium]MBT7325403.1 isoprenylcysteine carboxylmethyltransferase family protein [Anaerolineae bacterium]